MTEPLVVVDVHYPDAGGAVAAAVVAGQWTDSEPYEQRVETLPSVLPYNPGAFFERELPCILAVLAKVQAAFRAIVVDGYVELDEGGSPGLGGHLFERLQGRVAVIGVAKTAYRGAGFATAVIRGDSRRPLFVTARGISKEEASGLVRGMAGDHRVPLLLQRADRLARGLETTGEG